ncbi:hypothetical protein [Agrobacterium sp. SUL3]|uniref:hypothetical protein n=1 Tax=Agrobacterium sp. SUL3 TaxID=1701910 RepID=UPI00069C2EB6|nr:hypothetical protein [Agrobacterium sp. SUL3]KNY35548.1 hypothetical protein AKG12_00420 [Agrobacterium sp. SUL3]
MATLTVNGVKVQVDDSFRSLSPEQQESTVNEIAAQLSAGKRQSGPERSGGIDGAVRSAGRGVLGIGSYLDELNAATNATLAPIVDPLLPDQGYEKLPGATWGERYDQALGIQRRKDQEYDTDHPVASTALKIAGGVGSGGAVLRAAPAVGNFVLGNGGTSIGGRVLATGLAGGGTGVVQGFGAGEGGAANRVNQSLKEGAIGTAAGVAMMPVAAGANKLASSLARKILGESDNALNAMSPEARKYVLNELAAPDKIQITRQSLDELGPEAMLADVSPDWLGVARGAAARPGTRSMVIDPLNERAGLANARIRSDVAKNLGPDPVPSAIDNEIRANMGQVAREYGPVFLEKNSYDFTPITKDLDKSISSLRGDAQRRLQQVRGMLNEFGKDAVSNDPSVAFQTRQAIDGILETEQNPKVISALSEARQMVDDALTASVPRIKEVDASYSELARQREALQQGRPVLNNEASAMRPGELEQALSQGALPQGQQVGPSAVPTRMRQGALGEIYRAVGTKANDTTALRNVVRGEGDWNREKLGMLFGQEPSDNVLNAIDRETVFGDTANRVSRGSDTAMANRFVKFLDDTAKAQDVPADTTLVGATSRLGRSILQKIMKGNAAANADQVAEDIGRLSVARGDVREQIMESLLRAGKQNVIDQRRAAAVKALIGGGGLAGYQSLPGVRN